MNPQKWAEIKALFASALEVPAAERGAFLHSACADDAALRAELESLLASYDPDPDDASAAPDSLEGHRLDRYRIVRQIGAGGMGAVYLAVRADDAFNKNVAIKLVDARVDARAILDRFRAERQILATLDHPHIARLIDGGTTDRGMPYFVMDYVDGIRIDEYCDAHALPVADRLKVFRQVCAAVQYVHQNLVVHRDLKPGNILVTAEGIPKLLDFGIAKLLRAESFADPLDATRAEFRLLTPRYASPEQVRGEPITTASDVYSLGVILYELLTAHRPYKLKTESPIDVLRAVCDQEPGKPSTVVLEMGDGRSDAAGAHVIDPERAASLRGTVPGRLRRQLKGELDTIVMKALRKEPARRYASVEQLSEDLRRHLHGLPVLAHPDNWSYRMQKFVDRHRVGVAAAALLILSLVGGVLATSWQARIARAERARAERQFDDLRRVSTSFLFEFHAAVQNLPGSTPARQLIVQRALEYLSKLAGEAHGDRALQRELAEAYLKVGDVQGNPYGPNLGDLEGAARSYEKALQISDTLVAADTSDLAATRYLARSHTALGEVQPQLGKPTEALSHLRRATAMLESLVGTAGADRSLREQLAHGYQALGDLQGHGGLQNIGDAAGALDSYRKALVVYDELVSSDGGDKAARRGVALLHIRIGDLSEIRDDLAAGLREYRTALDIAKKLSAEDPTNAEDRRRLALAHRKVGGIQEDLGEYTDALHEYDKAAAVNEALMNADPTNVQAAMGYVISLRWSGDLLKKMRDNATALRRYRTVLDILERLASTQPTNVTVRGRRAEMLIVTAQLLSHLGEPDEARRLTTRGLALTRELASQPEVTPDDLSQCALAFLSCEPKDLRDPATALRYASEAVRQTGDTDSTNLDILAEAYFQNGDRARAIATEEKAIGLLAPLQNGRSAAPMRRKLESQLARFKAGNDLPARRPSDPSRPRLPRHRRFGQRFGRHRRRSLTSDGVIGVAARTTRRPVPGSACHAERPATAGGFDSDQIGCERELGAIPHRKQARRGWDGRGLSCGRHALGPRCRR